MPFARRAKRSFKLGFEACVGVVGGGDACFSFSRQLTMLFRSSTGDSFGGIVSCSCCARRGGEVAIVEISMRGLEGTRDWALDRVAEEGAEDAALPGRLGPTRVARGASSESDDDAIWSEQQIEQLAQPESSCGLCQLLGNLQDFIREKFGPRD